MDSRKYLVFGYLGPSTATVTEVLEHASQAMYALAYHGALPCDAQSQEVEERLQDADPDL